MSDTASVPDFGYDVIIEKGHTPINDLFIRHLAEKVRGTRYLDIGCNTGYLLQEAPGGIGVDASKRLVGLAQTKGLDVYHCWAEKIPFADKWFDIAVLSCILIQCENPEVVIREALRVADKVIGFTEKPGLSKWGVIGGTPWVKSLTPQSLFEKFNATLEDFDEIRWYFEISNEKS
jgi:SAM-dependent methyltransferase